MNQLLIDGVQAPPRPKVTDDMVREAAEKLISRMSIDAPADDIVAVYRQSNDGYELARELDDHFGWSIDMSLVEALDGLSSDVRSIHEQACKEWALDYNIQPLLPIGTEITRGVITGVSDYSPAKYLVKERGCTEEGRFLLVNFEDAQAAKGGLE